MTLRKGWTIRALSAAKGMDFDMGISRPNIILINCDDLGYGDLGCYGSKVNNTPYIDKMAEEGMRFTDFYMASPVCSPSRGAMLTGCYPPRIGFGAFEGKRVLGPGQGVGLNGNEKTLASVLKQAGYSTMIIGKWHCGDQPEFLPTRHGFDHYYGLPYSNDMGRQKGTDYCPLPLLRDEEVIQQQPDMAALTERYTERAVEFIRGRRDVPFFLYLAHMYVHLPHYAPERFLKESKNGEFGAVAACLDWSTGVLLNELKECGIDDKTLVIFTSDNGGVSSHGGSNDPLRGKKRATWEGGVRVPCIFRWPGSIPAGAVYSELACSLDFFSTIAKVAGAAADIQNKIDSLDVSEAIFSGGENPRKVFFYYYMNNLEAVRSGKWKLKTRNADEVTRFLFDLEDDIGETRNVYDEYPDIVAELSMLMEICREDIGDEAEGINGKNVRSIGRVDNPVELTCYDPEHPYIVAMYEIGRASCRERV